MVKRAAIRAIRTAAQTLAGSLVALPTANSIIDVAQVREPLAVAAYVSTLAGVVSFLQNIAEDNSSLDVPKG